MGNLYAIWKSAYDVTDRTSIQFVAPMSGGGLWPRFMSEGAERYGYRSEIRPDGGIIYHPIPPEEE